MAEKVVSVRVAAKVDGAVAGIRKVKSSVDDLTKADLKPPQKAFDQLSTKAALMGGAVVLGIGKAVSSFADFDAAMSAAGAATNAAGAEMDALRSLAVKAGQDTMFSATEAAQGITEMAKAGVTAGDILNGGLKGGLDLAAAGQLDVGRASEIAATALNQFNLKGKDVAHVADLYAAAAGKAQGSVEDIAQAMKYAGVTANSMGVSIEETTGVIGLFASKGIVGEQAGTSFRSMLMSLTSPSKIAAAKMDELGINVYDTAGKFVGLQGAAEILRQKLGPLDEATRNQALGQIFGNEAMGAAITLYQAGGAGVDQWTKSVNDAGFASEQAAKLTDNLRGDVERLGGSLETTFIQTGSSANAALRTLTQTAEGAVNIIGKVPGPILLAGSALAGLALTVPKGLSVYRNFTSSLDTMGLSMDKISTKAPRAAKAISGLAKASAIAATVGAVGSGLEGMWLDVAGANDDATRSLDAYLAKGTQAAGVSDLMRTGFHNLGSTVEKAFGTAGARGYLLGFADEVGTAFGAFGPDKVTEATAFFDEIDAGLAGLVQGGNAEGAAKVFGQIATEAQRQGVTLDQLKGKLPEYAAALATAGAEADGAAGGTGAMATAADGLEQSATDAQQALDDLKKAILGLGSPVADQMQAEREFQAAIDDAAAAVKENGRTLDQNTEKGRANQAALESLRAKILEKVSADYALTGSADSATASMKKGRDEFVKAAVAAGKTKKEAEDLATKLGLVPSDVQIMVSQQGAAATGDAIDYAARPRTAVITVEARIAAAQSARIKAEIASIRGFDGGGFTGWGGKLEPAGVVHKGEVVFEKAVVDREGLRPLLDLRAGKARIVPGYADGGLVGAPLARYVSAPPPVVTAGSTTPQAGPVAISAQAVAQIAAAVRDGAAVGSARGTEAGMTYQAREVAIGGRR